MILDIENNPINIKELTISQPPEKVNLLGGDLDLVTDEDFENMVEVLGIRWETYWPAGSDAINMAADMKLACPNRFSKLEFGKDPDIFNKLTAILEKRKGRIRGLEFQFDTSGLLGSYARCMKILYPNRFAELGLETEGWQMMRNDFDQLRVWVQIVTNVDALIAFPNKREEIVPNNMHREILLREIRPKEEQKKPQKVNMPASLFRILFPEEYPSIWNVYLDRESVLQELDNVREEFKTDRSWWSFAAAAKDAKILLADEVSITPEGLKIVMPGDIKFTDDKFDLPIRRSF